MPMLGGDIGDGTGLGVCHNKGRCGVKTELGPQHADHPVELLAVHLHLRRDNEMPDGIGAAEPACIGHGVIEVGNRALHDLHRLVVVRIAQMPGQSAGPSRSPEACGLDEHGQRPSSIWTSARVCTRSSVRPWRASMALMRRRSDATAWASSDDRG